MSYTITEDCSLPSKGLVYNKTINTEFKIRSMTTEDEMKRLARTERPYKQNCEIIDDCIVGAKPGISSYDMCLGDYQYLLNKLRVATYGPEYKIVVTCPHCLNENKEVVDLEAFMLHTFDEKLTDLLTIQLPKTEVTVGLKLQTPRSLDETVIKRKEMIKKSGNLESDPTVLFLLHSLVDTVDGKSLDFIEKDNFIRKLPMADTNKILNTAKKLNDSIGYDLTLDFTCNECGLDYTSSFRITDEFFGPTEG